MKLQNAKISFTVALLFCLNIEAQSKVSSISEITTLDGKTYRSVAVLRTDPDGMIVSYQLARPGIAMAKLKFANLPESLRSQYGYNQEQATAFAAEQAQATAQWQAKLASQEGLLGMYRTLAELHRSLAGDAIASYSISLSSDGKVSAQGYTGGVPPYYYYPWASGFPFDYGSRWGAALLRSGQTNAVGPSGY